MYLCMHNHSMPLLEKQLLHNIRGGITKHVCPALRSSRVSSMISSARITPLLVVAIMLETNGIIVQENEECSVCCFICLDRPNTFVFEKCKHDGVCGKCRTLFVMQDQYIANKGGHVQRIDMPHKGLHVRTWSIA